MMKNKCKTKDFILIHKYQICFWVIVVFTAITRVYKFGSLPCGLNPDEASIGYDAWAILNYGIDRNGTFLPVNLISWGSGQNALYAYLSMPFIKLFGLNIITVRLVNLIFGILSVILTYFIVKPFLGKKYALFAMGFVAISPWHIMLCRWGLEANLFPLVFTIGVFLLVKGIENKKYLPFAAAVFAISLYSYGAAYVVVPLFMITFAVYAYFKTDIKLKQIIFSAIVFIIIALPIGLCFFSNRLGWGDIKIFGLTAPYCEGINERWSALTEFKPLNNLKIMFEILFLQTDFTITNQVIGYGYIYFFSLPITVFGVIRLIKEKSHLSFLLFSWFLCSLPLFFIYSEANINRVNIIFIPIIIITGIGIGSLSKHIKLLLIIFECYIITFGGFALYYYGRYNEVLAPFFYSSIEDALPKAIEIRKNDETIYVTESLNKPYIYALFFSKTSPVVFLDTADIPNPGDAFYDVNSFEGFVLDTKGIERGEKGIYVLQNKDALQYLDMASEYYTYKLYTVLKIE